MHTTNYFNTLIQASSDPSMQGRVPPQKEPKTIAQLHYELLADRPYAMTSDELLLFVHRLRSGAEATAEEFYSKGQPCLRCSPLAKTYGWGFHFDPDGKVALLAVGSAQYEHFLGDPSTQKVLAMRAKR